jgi:hypothetical protein
MQTHEQKTQFAQRCGVNRATVTRWHQAGRLVVDAETGLVDIDASIRLLESTRGSRWDVAERWRAYRAEQAKAARTPEPKPELKPEPKPEQATRPTATASDPTQPGDNSDNSDEGLDLDGIGRRTRIAQMLKEEAIARQKQREDELLAGSVIRRADVRRDLTDATAVILSAWDNLPDRVAPLLVDLSDQAHIRALLREEIERIGYEVADALKHVGEQRTALEDDT